MGEAMQIQATGTRLAPTDNRVQDRPEPAGAAAVPDGADGAPVAVVAETLHDAVATINRELLMSGRELSFSVDEESGKTVLRVLHSGTGEVVRQIPHEAVLAVAARLKAGEPMDSLGLVLEA